MSTPAAAPLLAQVTAPRIEPHACAIASVGSIPPAYGDSVAVPRLAAGSKYHLEDHREPLQLTMADRDQPPLWVLRSEKAQLVVTG